MNVFDEKKTYFFVKIYTDSKLENVQPTKSPNPEEGENLGRKICEK